MYRKVIYIILNLFLVIFLGGVIANKAYTLNIEEFTRKLEDGQPIENWRFEMTKVCEKLTCADDATVDKIVQRSMPVLSEQTPSMINLAKKHLISLVKEDEHFSPQFKMAIEEEINKIQIEIKGFDDFAKISPEEMKEFLLKLCAASKKEKLGETPPCVQDPLYPLLPNATMNFDKVRIKFHLGLLINPIIMQEEEEENLKAIQARILATVAHEMGHVITMHFKEHYQTSESKHIFGSLVPSNLVAIEEMAKKGITGDFSCDYVRMRREFYETVCDDHGNDLLEEVSDLGKKRMEIPQECDRAYMHQLYLAIADVISGIDTGEFFSEKMLIEKEIQDTSKFIDSFHKELNELLLKEDLLAKTRTSPNDEASRETFLHEGVVLEEIAKEMKKIRKRIQRNQSVIDQLKSKLKSAKEEKFPLLLDGESYFSETFPDFVAVKVLRKIIPELVLDENQVLKIWATDIWDKKSLSFAGGNDSHLECPYRISVPLHLAQFSDKGLSLTTPMPPIKAS